MKAWILQETGTIKYEETQTPFVMDGEVLISVKTAGICGSDIPRIYRDGAHTMPIICGHEFAGEVVEIGKGVDRKWLNKRVGVFPLIPCRECIACQQKKYEMCRNYGYIGSRQDGAFAEYVRVPVQNLIELPTNVSFEVSAMLEPMSVAVHAMRRAEVKPTDKVIVYGLGTIGLLLVMFLLEKGVSNIYVIGNKEIQKKAVLEMGLKEENFFDRNGINSLLNKKINGKGADIVFECIGKNEIVSQCIELATIGGKVCLVGNPQGDMTLEKSVYWKILRNQLTILGTWNSSFTQEESDDWHYVLQKLAEGKIQSEKLITHRFAFEELEKGLHIMRDKKEEYIKVMLESTVV